MRMTQDERKIPRKSENVMWNSMEIKKWLTITTVTAPLIKLSGEKTVKKWEKHGSKTECVSLCE